MSKLSPQKIVGNCRHCLTVLFAGSFVVRFVLFVFRKRPENFFQSLENARKIFPIIGKNWRIFPTIGKLFSNHWKMAVPAAGQRIVQGAGEGRFGVANVRGLRVNRP